MDPTEILARHWGMEAAQVRPLGGGMNSDTWLVEHEGSTYVAKSVSPTALAALVAGAEVATALAGAGFVTGRPVPTRDGRLVLAEPALAVLEHVPGRELDGETDEEQVWIARTLAGVHAASDPATGPSTATFALDWLSPQMPGVDSHPWLTAAIEAVRDETDSLIVTWSVLHTDPAPEAFIHDDPLGAHEMQHLDAFRRFREAVQGAYFAGRLAADDLTGGVDHAQNQKGLDDARRRLGALGLAKA